MKKYIGLFLLLVFGLTTLSAGVVRAENVCPTTVKSCKVLGLFSRSSTFKAYQIEALKMCKRSTQGLAALKSIEGAADVNDFVSDMQAKFTFGLTILNNTVDGCSKKEFQQSASIFKSLYNEVETFTVDKINTASSDVSAITIRSQFVSQLEDESLRNRFLTLLGNSDFSSIPATKNVFSSGSGKILGYDSKLRDYTGESKTGNAQLRNILNNLFVGIKKILIPVSIFLIVFAGVQLFVIGRDKVSDEVPKKRDQVFNIMIGWTVFSVAFTLVDFVIFGNGREDFILRDDFENGEYVINEDRSMEFASRIFGEIEGAVDFLLTLFVIVSIFFLVVSCVRLIFGDDDNYEATKKQVMQSMLASVVAISLKPLLRLFYQNGEIVRPNSVSVIEFLSKWADYVLGFIGVFATISLIYGGIRLVIDYGNGEAMDEAKKIIQYAVIGIILAFSAWSIVNFFATPAEQVAWYGFSFV